MTLSLLLTLAAAQAAPVTFTGPAPEAPGAVTLFAPSVDGSITPIDQLQDLFGLAGLPVQDEDLGGVSRVRDGELSTFAFDQGGAMFSDLGALKSHRPIQPRGESALYADAGAVLDELGLFDVQNVELIEGRGGRMTVRLTDPQGRARAPFVTHEKASFQQMIDGLPGFGGGAEIDVVYGRDGRLAMVQHAVRELEELGTAEVIDAQQAVDQLARRAEEGAPYNLHLIAMGRVDSVEIRSAELGYYVPDLGQIFETYEPVWELRGVVHGTSVRGAPMEAELLWYEPAVPGHELLPLDIPAID